MIKFNVLSIDYYKEFECIGINVKIIVVRGGKLQ